MPPEASDRVEAIATSVNKIRMTIDLILFPPTREFLYYLIRISMICPLVNQRRVIFGQSRTWHLFKEKLICIIIIEVKNEVTKYVITSPECTDILHRT